MWSARFLAIAVLIVAPVCCDLESRTVNIAQGPLIGYKDAEEDIFKFYGIPYATAPVGQDKYKAPLPGPEWITPLKAVNDDVICPQYIMPSFFGLYESKQMQENCLFANVFVPNTKEKNIPVIVYVHGGAFQMGFGNLFRPHKLVSQKKVIVITFNYRLGIHGFLCLGTEKAPGNAGMKDQLALLRWVKQNIANFGGNPHDITLAGYSAGSAAVDLLMLSPAAKGLFTKVIPESGGNLAAFSIQSDPIEVAKEFAEKFTAKISLEDTVQALEEFYLSASLNTITSDLFFDKKDSVFEFSPCVERDIGQPVFLKDSPYNILKSGNYDKVPLLYGFANFEGMLRLEFFNLWYDEMNKKFSDFLPRDLKFSSTDQREEVAKKVKEFYFGEKPVGNGTILGYIDFFSDVIFAYPMMAAVKLHIDAGHDKIYLYEYSYTDDETPHVPHTNVKGANHCGQTAAIFDGVDIFKDGTNLSENNISEEQKKIKALMRTLWSNFARTGIPVPPDSSLPSWPPTGRDGSPHMSLAQKMELRGTLLEERMRLWDDIYKKHYKVPQPPSGSLIKHNEL